jgi:thiamine transport system substrate-binding protein
MNPSLPPAPEPSRPGRSRHRSRRAPLAVLLALGLTVALVAAACSSTKTGGSTDGSAVLGSPLTIEPQQRFPEGTTLKVVTHDSFAVSQDVLAQFTAQTGVEVQLIPSGDAVTAVNKAILTKGNPEGDVLFGIDENLLTSAFDAGLFQPYQAAGLKDVPAQFQVDPQHRVTPIDHGDVCVNYDRTWFTDQGLPLPTTFADLAQPALKGKLVVQDPSASSPGLAFMLATIASQGGADDASSSAAWVRYWQQLKDNGVKVVDGWETAYNVDFSGSAGKGDRPLVVSYASSPPFEVTDPATPPDRTPTGVIADTCYRQTEFAGVLAGAAQPEAAAAFIEFMLSVPFQEDVPEQMYVFPVNSQAVLPETWQRYTTSVAEPLAIPYDRVGAKRDGWVQQWSALFR